MKTIQSQELADELRKAVEQIAAEIEKSGLSAGKLTVERVMPSSTTQKTTPAAFPHLMVEQEVQKKVLGLIGQKVKKILFIVKEGFYDIEEKGRKDMFVFIREKGVEAIVKKVLDEYGQKNGVTEIVYKA